MLTRPTFVLCPLVLLTGCSPKPAHNANWYYYWEKDNVIVGLDRAGSPASRWDWDVEAANQGVWGASHGPSDGYVLTDLCITNSMTLPITVQHKDTQELRAIGASTTFGIEQAAATAAHEKYHVLLWRELNSGSVDADGDRLADAHEGTSPHNLVVGYTDTWDLAFFVNSHYATYGDNEFLTRIAELGGLANADLSADWSEGGAQWQH